jgi:hypothetical protein
MLRALAIVGVVVAGLGVPGRAPTDVRAAPTRVAHPWSEAPATPPVAAICDGELAFQLSIAAIATAP